MKNKLVDMMDAGTRVPAGSATGPGKKTKGAGVQGVKGGAGKPDLPGASRKDSPHSTGPADFQSLLAHAIPPSTLPVSDARRVETAPHFEAGTAGPGSGPTSKAASVSGGNPVMDEASGGTLPSVLQERGGKKGRPVRLPADAARTVPAPRLPMEEGPDGIPSWKGLDAGSGAAGADDRPGKTGATASADAVGHASEAVGRAAGTGRGAQSAPLPDSAAVLSAGRSRAVTGTQAGVRMPATGEAVPHGHNPDRSGALPPGRAPEVGDTPPAGGKRNAGEATQTVRTADNRDAASAGRTPEALDVRPGTVARGSDTTARDRAAEITRAGRIVTTRGPGDAPVPADTRPVKPAPVGNAGAGDPRTHRGRSIVEVPSAPKLYTLWTSPGVAPAAGAGTPHTPAQAAHSGPAVDLRPVASGIPGRAVVVPDAQIGPPGGIAVSGDAGDAASPGLPPSASVKPGASAAVNASTVRPENAGAGRSPHPGTMKSIIADVSRVEVSRPAHPAHAAGADRPAVSGPALSVNSGGADRPVASASTAPAHAAGTDRPVASAKTVPAHVAGADRPAVSAKTVPAHVAGADRPVTAASKHPALAGTVDSPPAAHSTPSTTAEGTGRPATRGPAGPIAADTLRSPATSTPGVADAARRPAEVVTVRPEPVDIPRGATHTPDGNVLKPADSGSAATARPVARTVETPRTAGTDMSGHHGTTSETGETGTAVARDADGSTTRPRAGAGVDPRPTGSRPNAPVFPESRRGVITPAHLGRPGPASNPEADTNTVPAAALSRHASPPAEQSVRPAPAAASLTAPVIPGTTGITAGSVRGQDTNAPSGPVPAGADLRPAPHSEEPDAGSPVDRSAAGSAHGSRVESGERADFRSSLEALPRMTLATRDPGSTPRSRTQQKAEARLSEARQPVSAASGEGPAARTGAAPMIEPGVVAKGPGPDRPGAVSAPAAANPGAADPSIAAPPPDGGSAAFDRPRTGIGLASAPPPPHAAAWNEGLTPHGAARLRTSVAAALREGRNELTMELDPRHLGKLKIHLEVTGQSVTAHLLTETNAARQALEAHKTELAQMLQAQGFTLEQFDVNLDRAPQRDTTGHQPAPGEGKQEGFGDSGSRPETPAARPADRVALGMNRVDRVA